MSSPQTALPPTGDYKADRPTIRMVLVNKISGDDGDVVFLTVD